jgi:hypothetical protein
VNWAHVGQRSVLEFVYGYGALNRFDLVVKDAVFSKAASNSQFLEAAKTVNP